MTTSTETAKTTGSPTDSSQSIVEQKISEGEILATFKAMRADNNRLAVKIGELEGEKEEHRMVIETLEPVEAERKCFRLLNGVLVERKVSEVLPALKQNYASLSQIIEQLVKTFQDKLKEIAEYQTKYNIKIEQQGQLTGGGGGQ